MTWFTPILDSQSRYAEEHVHSEGHWCGVCGRFLVPDECGVIVHDDKPHPIMESDEEGCFYM